MYFQIYGFESSRVVSNSTSIILLIATASEEPFPYGVLESLENIKSNGSDMKNQKILKLVGKDIT